VGCSHATNKKPRRMCHAWRLALPPLTSLTEEIMSSKILKRNRWQTSTVLGTVLCALMTCGLAVADDQGDKNAARSVKTATPIKHLIVLIGENRSFDNIYATYQPKNGQTAANLLSMGIVRADGMPGPNFFKSQQYVINPPYSTYFIDAKATAGKTIYQQAPGTPTFPVANTAYVPTAPGGLSQGQGPFSQAQVPHSLLPTIQPSLEAADLGLLRTGASGLPKFSDDTRVTNAEKLPNGSFQITGPTLPYDNYTGDMVHGLYHMWQQSDCDVLNATPDNPSGCLSDLYPFVGVARDDGSGANSMASITCRRATFR
jgi:phospholipase C